MKRLLKESFIPVLLVFASIFLLVYYSHYIADLDAEQVTVIEIPAQLAKQDTDQGDESDNETSEADEMKQIAVMRVDDPESQHAYALLKNNQWKMAEKSYLDLLKTHDSSQVRADLAYIYYIQKKYEPALQQVKSALEKKPVYLAAYYYRAKIHSRLKNYVKAENDYLFFIKQMPQHYYAHFNLGLIKYKQKNFKQAIEFFKLSSTLAPGKNKSKALNYLAKSYKKLGKGFYPQARQAYQASIRVAPGEVKSRLGIASLLPDTAQGRSDAKEIYNLILNLKPNESRAHSRLASIYKQQGKYQEAKNFYEKAIEFNPSSSSSRYNLGLLLLKRKKWQGAIDQFQAVARMNPAHAKAYFNLGRAHYRLKNYQQALTHYQKALDIKGGDYPEVAINIGLIHSAKKEYEKAINTYKAALKKDAKSEKLHFNLGLAYVKSGQEEKAMKSFLLATKYKSDYEQAWYSVAKIYSQKEQFNDAVTAYRKALIIKPNYRSAQLGLAESLTRIGQLEQAEIIYRQVLSVNPRYFPAWLNLGMVLMDQKKHSEAEGILYQASHLNAENNKVINLLANAQFKQGNLEESEKYYRMALDMRPDSERYRLEYIRVLMQLEKYQMAKIEADKGVTLFPDSQEIIDENNKINIKLNIQL